VHALPATEYRTPAPAIVVRPSLQAGDLQQQRQQMQMQMQMQQPAAITPATSGWLGGPASYHPTLTASFSPASSFGETWQHQNWLTFLRAYAMLGGDPFVLSKPADFRDRFSHRMADQVEMFDYAKVLLNKMNKLPLLI
jgi:hypothetical protein